MKPEPKYVIDMITAANFVPTYCEVHEGFVVFKQFRDNQPEESVVIRLEELLGLAQQLERNEIFKCCSICGGTEHKGEGCS